MLEELNIAWSKIGFKKDTKTKCIDEFPSKQITIENAEIELVKRKVP